MIFSELTVFLVPSHSLVFASASLVIEKAIPTFLVNAFWNVLQTRAPTTQAHSSQQNSTTQNWDSEHKSLKLQNKTGKLRRTWTRLKQKEEQPKAGHQRNLLSSVALRLPLLRFRKIATRTWWNKGGTSTWSDPFLPSSQRRLCTKMQVNRLPARFLLWGVVWEKSLRRTWRHSQCLWTEQGSGFRV
jgi:hypothetical protein